jgi:hypothetical protein
MRAMLPALVLVLALSGCGESIARGRIEKALTGAGMPVPVASCMAGRMVDQLTMAQLRKLEALKGVNRSPLEIAAALQKIDDPQVVQVTLTAAGVCWLR